MDTAARKRKVSDEAAEGSEVKRNRWDAPTGEAKVSTNGSSNGGLRQDEVAGSGSKPEAAKAAKPSISLDALAKAKLALQKQKELAEKQKQLSERLKKLPQLPKPGTAVPAAPAAPAASLLGASVSPGIPPSGILPTPGLLPAALAGGLLASTTAPGFPGAAPIPGVDMTAIMRAQEFAAKLGFQPPPGAGILGQVETAKATKAPVLRLDAQGREIDEEGKVVEKPKIGPVSTLKVNINKAKKEAFKILRPELLPDPEDAPFFDPRMKSDRTKLVRNRKPAFQFVEEGKWSKQAEHQRMRALFGDARARELRAREALLARGLEQHKGGAGEGGEAEENPNLIEVGERVAGFQAKKKGGKEGEKVPNVEWWDAHLLSSGSYADVADGAFNIKEAKLTIYVEHPVPIEPPAEAPPPPPQPLMLTQRERKKLRTQKRVAREKEKQEMIRQGLLEPPKPKVKMSNLMRVLGSQTQAVKDPTRMEREVRAAAAERERAHEDRNAARRLTPAERREKKERKLFEGGGVEGVGGETIVSVYRVADLTHPQTRFKVDVNAQENRLTGCVVMMEAGTGTKLGHGLPLSSRNQPDGLGSLSTSSSSMCLVVVEGGAKPIKRYSKLMLRRIKWEDARLEDDEGQQQEPNSCELVWQGSVAQPAFEKFTIQRFRTSAAAEKYLQDHGVGHYWDLAENFKTE